MVEREGHIALISLDQVLTDSQMTTLATTLEELASDDDAWVIALRGRSGQFGVDPDPVPAPPAPAMPIPLAVEHELAAQVIAARLEIGPDSFGLIRRFPKPMIAILEGRLSGRGLAIALACDLRLTATSTSFRFDEARTGTLPHPGLIQLLSRLVGPAVAMDLLLTGRSLTAREALAVGLVSRVEDDLDSAAEKLLAGLAETAPLAARFAKEAVRNGGELPLESGVTLELDLSLLLQLTSDRAEGLAAFRERRQPKFTGS